MELPKFYNPVQTLLAARRETTAGGGGGAKAGEGGQQQQQQQQGAGGVEGAAADAAMQEISGGASSTAVSSMSDFAWRGMRTVAEIRREKNQAIPVNKDSLYKPIERAPRVFNPLRVRA